jgi:hypothetical protein
MRLFFYGTLLDPDVQALVLGRSLPADELTPAELRHFRRVYIAGRLYPMVLPHRGGAVDGAFTETLSKDELARIAIYEGSEYGLERHSVHPLAEKNGMAGPVAVWLHRSRAATRPSTRAWRLPDWQLKEKTVYLRDRRLWLASQSQASVH